MSTKEKGLHLGEANKILRLMGCSRTAEVLVSLIGVIGIQVLSIEVQRLTPR